ncbi:helix-turn-helix transcriptional regulator [Nocardiopsis sp. RSe5-2]|uniref:Helix-turn-helix transcriptional regulator n=1 Tax=Nocardiopsis endophytica TaxID=3018445 RepID=A0ABT4U521_9ACTN|nr:helix-turn-helix transcriptional regulator [Nocardiopsis endophytica]MDA2812049.1 helix-turn-helix transcriptional regulator [Nocardiopsis endophytica]
MSTIFGHGRLRLYLLKLLDESPKHGYEIISLLRDRFLGVYSPSPGTIYPRLARLEEEGLVTHEEVNGRKVYRLTDKGREELNSRSADLNDLEREITESVRDVARAVKEDVRDTISSLREELKYAASGGRRAREASSGTEGSAGSGDTADAADAAGEEGADRERAGQGAQGGHGGWWGRDWERLAKDVGESWKGSWGGAWGTWGSWGSGRTAEDEEASGASGEGDSASGGEHRGGRSEFERTLHEFADRVRDVVREGGAVGESAARDLKRILDDTLDVIQRDMAHWGPGGGKHPCGRQESSEEEEETTGAQEDREEREEPKGPFAQPPADEDRSDPWSTAVHEDPSPKAPPAEPEARADGDGDGPEDAKGDDRPGPA